ncbi:PepSY domain-containing protein [Neorhizobium sp. DAR64872/K0K18]|uniref:PepSY domain-containing protein n=1 Tax=Neorhizobium sp. DAR64872/K0K18 TaxID=3421958 RepID=UPI003D282F13
MGVTRRICLAALLAATLGSAIVASVAPAFAKDGDGGGDGSGSSGSGNDGGGDDGDNHGGDDDGGDDDGKDGAGSHDASGGGYGPNDSDRARDAVRSGQIMPLKTMLRKIDATRYGRIIDIRLSRSQSRDVYQLKLRDNNGAIRTLRVDARSGSLLGGG